jgi:ABC-type branched-subunit amino acid transport system ATPase component
MSISHKKPKTHKQTQQVLAVIDNNGAGKTAMHNATTERSVTANNGPQSSKHKPTKQQTKAPQGVQKKNCTAELQTGAAQV